MSKSKAERAIVRTTFHCYKCFKTKQNSDRANPDHYPACCIGCNAQTATPKKANARPNKLYLSGKAGDYFAGIDK